LYAITASDRLGNDRKNNFLGTIWVSTWTFLYRQLLLAPTVTPVGCGLSYIVVCRHYSETFPRTITAPLDGKKKLKINLHAQ